MSSGAMPVVLVGEREQRMYVLQPEGIDYIEADGNYVKLHASNAEYISRDSVTRLATVLSWSGFVRIERSLLVNVRAISYAQRAGRGAYAFTMTSGVRLQSGAKYRAQILRVLPLGQKTASGLLNNDP
jgi:two-component system, LytTR family, response regulator